MNKRLLCRIATFSLIGLLAMSTVYFAAMTRIREKELDGYRELGFARGYECLVAYLGEYGKVDPSLTGDRIATCFTFLPISSEGEEIISKFIADIRSSEHDSAARARAEGYRELLYYHLISSREKAYHEWAKSQIPLPEYPKDEQSLPAYTMPKEEKDHSSLEKAARELLGENGGLTKYRREQEGASVIGFRCPYSFAEYDEATLLLRRALVYRRIGAGDIGEKAALDAAKKLLEEQKYKDLKPVSVTKDRGCYVAVFSGELYEVTVGLGEDSAELCFFYARERKSSDGK